MKEDVKVRVHVLPTESLCGVMYDTQNNKYIPKGSMDMPMVREYRHLYFTPLEKSLAFRGDWYISESGGLHQWNMEGVHEGKSAWVSKVIATTDESLMVEVSVGTNEDILGVPIDYDKVVEVFRKVYVPKANETFLKEFCLRGGADIALLEYRKNWFDIMIPNVNDNNEVTIKFIN